MMRMHVVFVLAMIFLISVSSVCISKGCNGEWNKIYGGDGVERAEDFIETEDGFLLVGYKSQNDDFDGWIVKVDKQGNEIWSKTCGGRKEDSIHHVLPTEGGYMLVGYTLSYGGGEADFWVMKIDDEGEEQWNKTYIEDGKNYAFDAAKAENGCIMVGTRIKGGDWDFYAVKIDENGNEMWNRTYRAGEDCSCITKIDDGYLLGGRLATYGCLIKINEEGDIKWVRVYGDIDEVVDIVNEDNGFLLLGRYPPALIKTDKNGNKIWEERVGGWWEFANAIVWTKDGYAIVGSTDTYGIDSADVWLLKVDRRGNESWNKSFGGRGSEFAQGIIYLGDSYMILGNIQEGWDAWLIKCGDYAPPNITVSKPKEHYLYLFDREICPSLRTIAIGDITIAVEVGDSVEKIDRVEFYVIRGGVLEQELQTIVYNPPYEWKLDSATAGIYDITIGAYYGNAGAVAVDKINVWLFNL